MSSGACRALVAVLLALVASIGMALPVAAATDRLREDSLVVYKVDPGDGKIEVQIVLTFRKIRLWAPVVRRTSRDSAVQVRGRPEPAGPRSEARFVSAPPLPPRHALNTSQ